MFFAVGSDAKLNDYKPMDAVFKALILINILAVMAIMIMLYNRIRWRDELHGLFNYKSKKKQKDA